MNQLNLFGAQDLTPIEPHPSDEETRNLAAKLPEDLYLGTSSWSFAGWRGIVYKNAPTRKNDQTLLSRHGLTAYAKHPLLRAVGIDRTYYAPLSADDFAHYADSVPEGFRFLVKAQELVTRAFLTENSSQGKPARYVANELFLSPDYASREIIEPCIEGLGKKCGIILFQFPPQSPQALGDPASFAERLSRFIDALPANVQYAIELRNVEQFGAHYYQVIADSGAVHCYNGHPKMPPIRDQRTALPPKSEAPLVVRWMLRRDLDYEEARDRFKPFNRLAGEDPTARSDIATACRDARHAAYVIVNNKAEGCSPLSIMKLAQEIVG